LKLSAGKDTLPGRKQVFRQEDDRGRARSDIVARAHESLPGRPLLRKVMKGGQRLAAGSEDLERLRRRGDEEVRRLPERIRALDDADPPYEVNISDELGRYAEQVKRCVARRADSKEVSGDE